MAATRAFVGFRVQIGDTVQGDTSGCATSPVDFKTKVWLWPGQARQGQAFGFAQPHGSPCTWMQGCQRFHLSHIYSNLVQSNLVGDGLADGLRGALVIAAAVVVAVVPSGIVNRLGAGEHELRRPVGLHGGGSGGFAICTAFLSRAGGLVSKSNVA